MAQRVTLAIPNPANPATDINVGTADNPMVVSSSGGGGTGANPSIAGGEYNATPPTLTTGQTDAIQLDPSGNLRVRLATSNVAGADATSNSSLASFLIDTTAATALRLVPTAAYVLNGTTWDRDRKPNQTSRIVSSAATTNATVAKASAGDMFRASGYNSNAAARYLKIYNKATAPTVGTDTPIWTEYLAPQAKFDLAFPKGMYFSAGISYALVTGAPDADATAVAAGDILALNVAYA